jgi:hypothetical protein
VALAGVASRACKQLIEMSFPATNQVDAACCPLCGRDNGCQLCTTSAYKGPCWCTRVKMPEELLARVPEVLRNRACICHDCVREFHRSKNAAPTEQRARPGEFYFENGLLVFNAEYHLRRGYCCGSGCRHCPYPKPLLSRA